MHPKLALAGLVVTALYALTQWRDIGRSFQDRNVKYGSIALGSVLLVRWPSSSAINWISTRQNKRWDLTESSQFSLSDQTRQISADAQQPVIIRRVLPANASDHPRYRDQLGEYAYLSKQVTVEYIDADSDPVEAQKYEISRGADDSSNTNGRTERTNHGRRTGASPTR